MELDLSLAWGRVQTDRVNDFFPDPLDHRDFRHQLEDSLQRIQFAVERQTYVPTEAIPYDVPKPEFFLRPASYLNTSDRVLYQALIDTMAETIEGKLSPPEVVFAFRLDRDGSPTRMFRRGVARWLQFRSEIRKAYLDEGYNFLVNTDINAYFESIAHTRLNDLLVAFGVEKEVISLLIKLLACWNPGGRGIPQGFDASSLLGNCFLDPLDKHMVRAGVRFFRFNDDMCIFGRSNAEVRRAQQRLERELRALGLHIQTKKTVYFSGDEIREFVDERQDQIAAIDYADFVGDAGVSLSQTKALLDELLREAASFNERHFRKCINTLIKHHDDYAVDAVLWRLESMPHAAWLFAEYLRLFANRDEVQKAILEFLSDSDRNLFEWQEAWLLRALLDADTLSQQALDWARNRVQQKASSWLVQCSAIQLLEKFGDPADIAMLANDFTPTERAPVLRSRLRACKRLPANQRNLLFGRAANISDELSSTVAYLRRG
jgi:hypothetical protein